MPLLCWYNITAVAAIAAGILETGNWKLETGPGLCSMVVGPWATEHSGQWSQDMDHRPGKLSSADDDDDNELGPDHGLLTRNDS